MQTQTVTTPTQKPQTAIDLKRRLDRLFRFMGVSNYSEGALRLGIRNEEISRWLNGKHRPSPLALRQIKEAERKYCPQAND